MPCKDPEIRKQQNKEYRRKKLLENPNYYKDRYAKNRDSYIKSVKKSQTKNKNKIKEYNQRPDRKIINRVRKRMNEVLKLNSKSARTLQLLGCTPEFLRSYLESKFLPGMSWENYGINGWHMDHIIPCNSFDLSDPEQQKTCFHYTNLQPLWAKDNIKKGDRLV